MKTMWTSRVLILIVFCLSVAILPVANLSALDGAEEPPPRRNLVMLGAGLSFGFFSPADVNTYLEDWLSGFSAYGYEGTSSLLLYLAPRISFIYAPIEYVQFEVLGEMGWGPKIFLFDTGGSEFFYFNRYSGGFNVLGHLPLGRRYRKTLFLGVGIEYDYLTFEDYAAAGLGYRGELGFRMYMEKTALDIFAAGLYSRSMSGFNAADSPSSLELDYSSVMIGVNFYFMLNR